MSQLFPTKARIREIFAHLTRGDAAAFYAHVADDVDWTVMGSNVLSRRYTSKAEFMAGSLAPMARAIDGPLKLEVRAVIGGEVEEWAVVEMTANAKTKIGKPYKNQYSWSIRWRGETIVEVRAYLDGLLLNQTLEESDG